MEYNGWSSYETWLVGLWIDNEERLYKEVTILVQEAWDGADAPSVNARLTGREPFTREEKASLALSKSLHDRFEKDKPKLKSVWADLLNSALEEVNWKEVAEHYLENVETVG